MTVFSIDAQSYDFCKLFTWCLEGVWEPIGCLWVFSQCNGDRGAQSSQNNNGTFCLDIFPRASFQDFWRGSMGCLAMSGSVWRVSLECVVKALVKPTLRNAIPTTKRPVYKSTVLSPSAPCQHFQRVAEGCRQGVWSMSGECLWVCSGWLWVSSKRFGHDNAWLSPKSRIEGIYMCLCLFSRSAWRARKS